MKKEFYHKQMEGKFMIKANRIATIFMIFLISFWVPLQASAKDASWVKAKWHGEGGVIYLTEKGYLLRSWKGGFYYPMEVSPKDASWVKAKWHGDGGVIYLTEKGYLLRSWKGGYYYPVQ